MATVNGLTAERMEEIEAAIIVDAEIVGDNLILTRHDATTVDTGDVRGPMGPPGDCPIGTICDYIGTTAPTNWLTFGQTITNGQTSHPDLWALLPASMKSGANIVLPSVAGKMAVAYNAADADFNAIGDTGGAKTHTLTQAELPAAPVTVNPPATKVTDSQGGSPLSYGNQVTTGNGSGGNGILASFPGDWEVDITQFNSGNMGSGAAHNNMPPFITFQKIIRAL